MSTAPIITDLQKINPSAIIELFTITTETALHWSAATYRFHAGTNRVGNGDIIWAGNTYIKMPIQAEGFAFQKGQLPRPTLTISNALGTITAILLNVNSVTTGNDLTGATVTRIRTLARYLDSINFPGNTNPLGTPDPTAEFPQEIYKIDRKWAENREIVQFELAAVFDLAGIRAPKRQCTRTEFPSIGTFIAWIGKKKHLLMRKTKIQKSLVVYC